MRSASKRGLFVVVEGLDGAGTTTQAQSLARSLRTRGERAHFTAEPSSGPIGSQIRQALAGRLVGHAGATLDRRTLALLFAADRLDHLDADIEPKLAAGIHIVCDRYLLSSLAYQSLDAPLRWVEAINSQAPRPDLTLFLRVRPEVALRRRKLASPGARDLFERMPLQRTIAAHYERDVKRLRKAHRIQIIDGEAPLEDVTFAVQGAVDELLPRRRSR